MPDHVFNMAPSLSLNDGLSIQGKILNTFCAHTKKNRTTILSIQIFAITPSGVLTPTSPDNYRKTYGNATYLNAEAVFAAVLKLWALFFRKVIRARCCRSALRRTRASKISNANSDPPRRVPKTASRPRPVRLPWSGSRRIYIRIGASLKETIQNPSFIILSSGFRCLQEGAGGVVFLASPRRHCASPRSFAGSDEQIVKCRICPNCPITEEARP